MHEVANHEKFTPQKYLTTKLIQLKHKHKPMAQYYITQNISEIFRVESTKITSYFLSEAT